MLNNSIVGNQFINEETNLYKKIFEYQPDFNQPILHQ